MEPSLLPLLLSSLKIPRHGSPVPRVSSPQGCAMQRGAALLRRVSCEGNAPKSTHFGPRKGLPQQEPCALHPALALPQSGLQGVVYARKG